MEKNIDQNFEKKRQQGENDSIISTLIRNDSVEEFISYVNRFNIYLCSQIETSYYETNRFIMENNPSLIEYAAFFGSIQIFQYLRMNSIELEPTLWLYAIHSKNAELIHIIEEHMILEKNDKIYEKCFFEAIKCHHNDIANYIKDNYLLNSKINKIKIIENGIHYLNYEFFPDDFNSDNEFNLLFKFNYITLVDFFLEKNKTKIEWKIKIEIQFILSSFNCK